MRHSIIVISTVLLLAVCGWAQQDTLLIGPGDELRVHVFDTPELDQTARVTDAGLLPLILGGTVKVLSLTPSQAAHVIEQAFIKAKIMNDPRVLVNVQQYATQNVTVFGQVMKPGSYPVSTPRTLIDVLTLAGGFTDLADRHVTVQRGSGDPSLHAFVVKDLVESAQTHWVVYPGDRILVAKVGIVYVLGDVGRPGGYAMSNNSSSLTVLQAVAQAGGTLNSAVPSHTKLIRRLPDGSSRDIPISLSAMQKGRKEDIVLEENDILYVPFSYFRNAALGLTGIAASAASAIIYTVH